jgi:hypothetical protein
MSVNCSWAFNSCAFGAFSSLIRTQLILQFRKALFIFYTTIQRKDGTQFLVREVITT